MKHLARLAVIAAAGLSLAGCVIHVPNPFGGPELMLTGNRQADLASFQAFSASVRAGVREDEAAAKAFFVQNCPNIANASVQVATTSASQVSAATSGLITESAAQKQINNAQAGLSVATNICNAGTASSWVVAVQNVTAAFKIVAGWFK